MNQNSRYDVSLNVPAGLDVDDIEALNRFIISNQQRQKGADLAAVFEDLINQGAGDQLEGFIAATSRFHRTLRQGLMRDFIVPLVLKFADAHDTDNFDLRDEAACALAAKLRELIEDAPLPYI